VAPTDGMYAVRHSAALTRVDGVAHVRISGSGAYQAVNRVLPRDLYVRDGQITLSVLLDEEGRIFADCSLARDEDAFFILAQGPDADELMAYLRRHAEGVDDVAFTDVGRERGIISLDGPYAWEVMARWVGPEVIGLPYLTFFHFDDVVCCRSGSTGEYGYLLLVRHEALDEAWGTLLEMGRELDVATATQAELDLCALENWFFNIRGEGRHGLTPLELQLQWRVSRRKSFVGSEALERRRAAGITRRATFLASPTQMAVGDAVMRDGAERGVVLNAGLSPLREDWVGLALMDLDHAFPGVDALQVGSEAGSRGSARTVTPPVLTNRSLYVNPQVHSYASRHDDHFPPIVPR